MDIKKRRKPEDGTHLNGGFKRSKQELDSLSTGVGNKLKPCTKFFSTSGCPFGDSCHFLHYFPGGYNAVAQMMNLGPAIGPPSRSMAPVLPVPNGSAPMAFKNKLCNRYNTVEGCKFGDRCNYAHGEWELGKPVAPSHDDPRSVGSFAGRMGGRAYPSVPSPAASFGVSATAKISVDASLAGSIIGKGGVNSKQICRQTGTKLSIKDHETDPNLKSIELEGSFDQIKEASAMVRDLIARFGATNASARPLGGRGGHGPRSNFKTKLCDNFAKGSCSFGETCHFAHGAAELRKS